jgi:hypothetical protein
MIGLLNTRPVFGELQHSRNVYYLKQKVFKIAETKSFSTTKTENHVRFLHQWRNLGALAQD